MVISDKILWLHIPKTAGDATLRMFDEVPVAWRVKDAHTDPRKHGVLAEAHARAPGSESCKVIINLRRLPEVLVSYFHHMQRHGANERYANGRRWGELAYREYLDWVLGHPETQTYDWILNHHLGDREPDHCLRVSDLARHMRRPERFLGLHYFSPAQINPLVEVVKGEATSDEAYAEAEEFVRATQKLPLACRDSWGFAVNRFFCPYTNEASRLIDEGLATTAQVDRVAKTALGVAAGPFFVQNIIKPRINLHAIRNLAPLGGFYLPAKFLIAHGEADRPFEIAEDASGKSENDRIVSDRLRGATFLPILQELDEGVAGADAIDMGAQQALRFTPPCKLMDEIGRAEVERVVAPLCAAYGLKLPGSLAKVGSLRA